MVVENNQPNIKLIDVMEKVSKEHAAKTAPKHLHKIRLMPGINEVDDAAWTLAKENKGVRHMLKEGILAERSVKLTALSIPKAKALIAQTVDRDLLERWSDQDSRPEISEAILAQVVKITPTQAERDAQKSTGPQE